MKLFNPFKPYIEQVDEHYYVRVNWFSSRCYDRIWPFDFQWHDSEFISKHAAHYTLEDAQNTLEKVRNKPKKKFIEQ